MKLFARNPVVVILAFGVLGYAAGLGAAIVMHVRELGHFAITLGFIVAMVVTFNLIRHYRREKTQR